MSDQPIRNPDAFRQRQFQKTQFGHDPRDVPRPSYSELAKSRIALPARGMMITALLSLMAVILAGGYGLTYLMTSSESIRRNLGDSYSIDGKSESKLSDEQRSALAQARDDYVNATFTMMTGGILFGALVLMTVYTFIAVSASKMLQVKGYRGAYVASIMSVIPVLSPLVVVGIPFGIWSLIALGQPEVQRAFGVPQT